MSGLGRAGETLPLRNPTFTGRAEALAGLEERLLRGPVAVVALRGLGGVGKSQLALEYAHRMRQSGRYQLAAWVRADSAVSAAEDLAALAPRLGTPTKGTVSDVASHVVGALAARPDWLVVFDNAQKPGDLAGMLPGGGGHVLITSRNRAWSGIATPVDLREFSPAESVKFLSERSKRDEPEAAQELADQLGDLPLALAQAAAYIDTWSTTIRDYLDMYHDPALARTLREAGLDSGEYPASVAKTWQLSFTQLSSEHPAAVELLRLCAFLDPDDIDLELLAVGREEIGPVLAQVLDNRLERTETAGALAATSLATIPAEGHLRVHRLVQAVTRDQLDDDEASEWTIRALNLVEAILPSPQEDPLSWPVCARVAPHIEVAASHASSYPDLARKIGSLLNHLGIYLSASGQTGAAYSNFERALAIKKAAYDPDDPEVAKSVVNLGIAHAQRGEFDDAHSSFERARDIFQAAHGPDHPSVARHLGNLGSVQLQQGELGDACTNFERALNIFHATHGSNHPHVALTLTNLGTIHLRRGELGDAHSSFERALNISQTVNGPDHPDVAKALTDLGTIHLRRGELGDAHSSFERALNIFQAAHGPDHPTVGGALINLGIVQWRRRRLRDGFRNIHRGLAISQAAYGPGHPVVTSFELRQAIPDLLNWSGLQKIFSKLWACWALAATMASTVFVVCWACLEFGVHTYLPVALGWATLPFTVVLALSGLWLVSVRRNLGKNRVLSGAPPTRVVQSQQVAIRHSNYKTDTI